MEYHTHRANDGATLAYQSSSKPPSTQQQPTQCILLLHGFSGSSAYFKRNLPYLCDTQSWIVAPDMRGHGRSEHTAHGYHVARLAMDLHDLVRDVIRADGYDAPIYAVGCSIGAAVLWTYIELFTDADFAGFVFVDQAPLQDRSLFGNWGEGMAHYSCYDEVTTMAAQRAWSHADPKAREETYRGLVRDCLGYRYKPLASDGVTDAQKDEDEAFFTGISRSCDGVWLAKLLGDHTRYDHREAIGRISKPILVMMGERSGCFSLEAQRSIARFAQEGLDAGAGVTLYTFGSGHWLFWEEADKFNTDLWDWVRLERNYLWQKEHPQPSVQ